MQGPHGAGASGPQRRRRDKPHVRMVSYSPARRRRKGLSVLGRRDHGPKGRGGVPRTAGEAQARPRALLRPGWRRWRRQRQRRQRGWHGRHPWVPAVVRVCSWQRRPEARRPRGLLPGGEQRKRTRAAHSNKQGEAAASAPAASSAGSGGRRLGRRGSSAPRRIAPRCRGEQRPDRALLPTCVVLQRHTRVALRRHGCGIVRRHGCGIG